MEVTNLRRAKEGARRAELLEAIQRINGRESEILAEIHDLALKIQARLNFGIPYIEANRQAWSARPKLAAEHLKIKERLRLMEIGALGAMLLR